jgi:hypothetical protein
MMVMSLKILIINHDLKIAQEYFLKKIGNINRNDVNDVKIIITVDFDTRFDYKNGVEDEEEHVKMQ